MSIRFLTRLVAGLSVVACSAAFATPLTVDVAGVQSVGLRGNVDNTVLLFNVGANALITTVSYDVNLTATPNSFLSELSFAATDASSGNGFALNPGDGDAMPGTGSYTDMFDLVFLGASFNVGADGILRLEFFETFDDLAGADGQWNFGTITFDVQEAPADVPEPSGVLLMGAGLVVAAYARRRRA